MEQLAKLIDLQKWIKEVNYKSGWELRIYPARQGGIWLEIFAEVENSYKPSSLTEISIRSEIPPIRTKRDFLDWVLWRLELIERHECHEWFRWTATGRPVYDPHDDNAVLPIDQ